MLRWLIDRDPPAFKLSRLTRFRIILPSIIRRLPSKWLVIGLLALGFASPALSQAGPRAAAHLVNPGQSIVTVGSAVAPHERPPSH